MTQIKRQVGSPGRRLATGRVGVALSLMQSKLRRGVTVCLLLAVTASLSEAQRGSSFA